MKHPLLLWFCGLLAMSLLPACATAPPAPQQQLIAAYINAYNSRDLEAMAAMIHDDVEWISIEGAKQQVITGSKAQLMEEMAGYFASDSVFGSSAAGWAINGDYISVKETAYWEQDGEQKSQSAIAVYQLEEGLIRRIWYYPAQN
jgi:hypothetical protein